MGRTNYRFYQPRFRNLGFFSKKWSTAQIRHTTLLSHTILHYKLLGANTGAAIVLITAIRNGLSLQTKIPKQTAFVFMAFYLTFGLYQYETWTDILPLSSIAASYALFYTKGLPLRLTLLFCTICFIIYNISVGSIGPTIMETLILITNAHTILRIKRN